jgi:hypothetical protein
MILIWFKSVSNDLKFRFYARPNTITGNGMIICHSIYAKLLTVATSNTDDTDAIGTIGSIDVAFMY